MIINQLTKNLRSKKISKIEDFYVVTDRVEYKKYDQVFPLHPENQFFLDEIHDKIVGADVLDIGTGSGVLAIGVIKAGARKVIALETNPRARNYAGFNILLNGLEDQIEIWDGNEDIFKPVKRMRFGYIISNPPFEPTPSGIHYYTHSDGGMYGLNFIEHIFKELDNYLVDYGHAQISAFAPGDEEKPFMLIDLINKYLPEKTELVINPVSMRFNDFVNRFVDINRAIHEQVDDMKNKAMQNGISHLYLCMIHYDKGQHGFDIRFSDRTYQNWDLPIDSKVPMGF
jgi:SAM-dependent methyltransferase